MRYKFVLSALALGMIFPFTVLTASASDIVNLITVERREQKENLQYDVSYPYLEPSDQMDKLKEINARLKDTADRGLLHAQRIARGTSSPVAGSTRFTVKRNDLHIVSVVFENSLKVGDEEIIHHKKALCFHSEAGTLYRLNDLFKQDQDYRSALLKAAKQAIKDQSLSGELEKEENLIRHNTSFYLTKDSLILLYNTGSCFSKKAGCVELKINVKDLSACLKDGFF